MAVTLLDLLEDYGLLPLPDDELIDDVQPTVMAVLFAPGDDVPPQIWVRPDLRNQMVDAVALASRDRLARWVAGDRTGFQSYAPTVNRQIAILYDQTPQDV